MNHFRVAMNVVLAALLLLAGIYLLSQDSFVLKTRTSQGDGTVFSGISLYLLALGIMLIGAFAAVVAYCWVKGIIPMPDSHKIRPDPTYKGELLLRFWYLLLPAVLSLVAAVIMAKTR